MSVMFHRVRQFGVMQREVATLRDELAELRGDLNQERRRTQLLSRELAIVVMPSARFLIDAVVLRESQLMLVVVRERNTDIRPGSLFLVRDSLSDDVLGTFEVALVNANSVLLCPIDQPEFVWWGYMHICAEQRRRPETIAEAQLLSGVESPDE